MRIKDICRSHPSDHYMSTPSAIQNLGIKINGSTIEVYTPPVPSEICSFVKCVLPQELKGIGTKIKNWIVFKLCQGRPAHYPEIFDYLDKEFNINLQNQENFAEIVQRIYNAMFVSLCKASLKRTNYPEKNSHWVKDLNVQDKKDLSTYYFKIKRVPLGSKRVKLSNHHDGIDGYDRKGKKEDKAYGITKQVKKANKNENENENEKAYHNKDIRKICTNKIEKEKSYEKEKRGSDAKQNKPPLKYTVV